ncbi:MAG: DUF2071 domain-containing protein [Verrucomicrobiae bacterium]|nr:DUF2071 domain-containing protein [Verrucomicrobiae bacterium]
MKPDATRAIQQGQVDDLTLLSDHRNPSAEGWRRLYEHRFEPLFFADWERPVFLHFAVDPERLQPSVPFPLDLRDGKAWVTLVAFTMRGMRPGFGGRVSRWFLSPIATHPFLNVRTYVRVNGEPGIHFLTEWLPNRLAAILGPIVFGLPYRLGALDYHHAPEDDEPLRGRIENHGDGTALSYEAEIPVPAHFAPCPRGSIDEFLLERYTAFVAWRGGLLGYFRVWHRPWPQVRVTADVRDEGLLTHVCGAAQWAPGMTCTLAHFSPGSGDVAMGRPHFLTQPTQS